MTRFWIIFGLLSATGCSRLSNDSPDLRRLQRGHQAGILTDAEYSAKQLSLQRHTREIHNLDQSLAAGRLTRESYREQKARILAGTAGPAPSRPPAASTPPPATPTTPPTANTAGDHLLRMKLFKVMDANGYERPLVSATILVPIDWNTQGGTTWNIKDSCNTIQTTVRASGPDGRGIEIFPTYNWVWADDPRPLQMAMQQKAQFGQRACEVAPPLTAAQYAQKNLQRYRPGAQVVGVEPVPKLLAKLQQTARQTEQAAMQYRLQQRVRPDVARARVRYNAAGQPVEEWIYVVTSSVATLGPSYNMQTMQMGQAYTYQCLAYVVAEKAPQGRLDASEAFFELVAGTYRVNPDWQARVSNTGRAIQQVEQREIQKRSQIISKNADDIARIQREGYENAQRGADRRSEQWSQTMRGVETYRNPTTGETVELSNQYGQAWVNNRGEYLLSDQPGFDPNVTLRESWQPLQRVRP